MERIFIQACLTTNRADWQLKHGDDCVNSRFPGGRCYEYEWAEFKACVRVQYLIPQISYTLNLIFRYQDLSDVNSYNPLRYKLDGDDESRIFIIYPSDMRQDGWFIAPLYQFTSQSTIADLQFEFEYRNGKTLLVAGFEFQPSEETVELQVFEEYQDIAKVASQSLVYSSLDELKQILYKGIHLNGYKTWFSLNEKGEHYHIISMTDCLIPSEDFPSRYKSHYLSRFPAGLYQTNNKGFKTHVKTQLLSPSITYTVNLLFKSYRNLKGEQVYVNLKYRLKGETTASTVLLTNPRKDDDFLMAELYQLTSEGSIVDLEIIFENSGTGVDGVEGILFQPLGEVEGQVSKDDKVENIQTIYDSQPDTYWEQNFPKYYEEILNLSIDSKKELYSVLRRGYRINNSEEWLTVDKHGKICPMLPARAIWVENNYSIRKSSHESRFGEVLVIASGYEFEINIDFKTEVSPKTTYAAYFVYKLPEDQSTYEAPLCVWRKLVSGNPDSYIYLVNPPHTPVIGPKIDENAYNPLNRYKNNVIPQQRTDGWMEVKVWEFYIWSTTKTDPMCLYFKHPGEKNLKGFMVQGIELRPV